MRRSLETTVLPVGLATPLVVLGLAFVVLHALGGITNGKYLLVLLMARVAGVWMHTRYEQKVLEKSDRGVVYSMAVSSAVPAAARLSSAGRTRLPSGAARTTTDTASRSPAATSASRRCENSFPHAS